MSPALQLGLMAFALYVAAWGSQKLGVSSIVGFITVGVLLGPGGVIPVFAVTDVTHLLAELGLLLLLFYLGLEFSIPRFLEGGRATLVAGTIDLAHLPVGFGLGLLLGFGPLGSAFLAGALYISSSGVIAKLLAERDLVANPEAERTLGVLVFEDLAMVVVLGGLGIATVGGDASRFLGVGVVLIAYVLLVRFGRRGLERLLSREGEALVLLLLAMLVLVSLGAKSLGFPEAVAAFLLGMLVSESSYRVRVETSLASWHAVAAAVFFFDVGLHVTLGSALRVLPAALLLLAVTTIVQLATGFISGRLTGLSARGSIGHGLMLLPRGEFSLVVVGLAAGAQAIAPDVRDALYATVSWYVLFTVVLGSVVFSRYDGWSESLGRWLRSPAARRREEQRQRDLDAMRLD